MRLIALVFTCSVCLVGCGFLVTDHGRRWDEQRNHAFEAQQKGDLPGAEKLYQAALADATAVSADGLEARTSTYELAHVYFLQKKYPQARPFYVQLLEGVKKEAVTDPTARYGTRLTVVNAQRELAAIYAVEGQLAESEKLYKEALRLAAACSQQVAQGVASEYAALLRKMGKPKDAQLLEAEQDANRLDFVMSGKEFQLELAKDGEFARVAHAAIQAFSEGEFAVAEKKFHQVIKLAASDPALLGGTLEALDSIYNGKQPSDLRRLLQYGLTFAEKAPPAVSTSISIVALAKTYRALNQEGETIRLLKKAFAYEQKNNLEKYKCFTLCSLADCYFSRGDFSNEDKVLALAEKSANKEGNKGDLAWVFYRKGLVAEARHKDRQAAEIYRSILKTCKQALVPDDEIMVAIRSQLEKLEKSAPPAN